MNNHLKETISLKEINLEEINLTYLSLFINPITNKINKFHKNLFILFMKEESFIFPEKWLNNEIPLILLNEREGFHQWFYSISPLIWLLKSQGKSIGIVEKKRNKNGEDLMFPGETLNGIKGYSGANSLDELYRQEEENKIMLMSPSLYIKEVLYNLYNLYRRLEEKDERFLFLKELNPNLLCKSNGIYIKEGIEYLDICFLKNGEVSVKTESRDSRISNKMTWVEPNLYPLGFIFWVILLDLSQSSNLIQSLNMYLDNGLKGIWQMDYTYGVVPKEDSIKRCIKSNMIKQLVVNTADNQLGYPNLLFSSPISLGDNVSSSSLIRGLLDNNIPVTPHK